MYWKCELFGHAWVIGETVKQCTRCGKTQTLGYDGLNIHWVDVHD